VFIDADSDVYNMKCTRACRQKYRIKHVQCHIKSYREKYT